MLSNKSLILVAMLVLISSLSAFSISDSYFGHRYGALDARSFAMGGAGAYNDMRPAGFVMNPANLTAQKSWAGLNINTVVNRADDSRMIPLYNSFDNYIDDAVYASNINAYTDFAGAGFASISLADLRLGLGLYHNPYLSYNGKYREEIRNNRNTDDDGYPEKIAQNDIDNDGTLYKTGMAIALAYEFADYWDLNLGFDFGMMNAEVNQETTIRWSDWAVQTAGADILPEYSRLRDWELEGEQMKLGLALRLGTRWGLGMSYVPESTLTLTGTDYTYRDAYRNTPVDSSLVVMDGDYELPSEFRVGMAYYPRNIMNTVFNFDMEMVGYSQNMDFLDDVYNFYVGVEHHVVNRTPLRLGFQAVNSYMIDMQDGVDDAGNDVTLYTANKILSPMVSAGSSIQLYNNVVLDLGFGYCWREYEALDLFGDGYYNDKIYTGQNSYLLWPNQYIELRNRGWENPDKVKENYITLNAGISFSW